MLALMMKMATRAIQKEAKPDAGLVRAGSIAELRVSRKNRGDDLGPSGMLLVRVVLLVLLGRLYP